MKKILISLVLLMAISSCNKKKFFDGPNFFQDDFETYSILDDLIIEDDQLWSFTQITKTGNTITVDTSNFSSGSKALRFEAKRSTSGDLSKCSIAKQNMAFWDGETVRMTAWYYLEGIASHQWLFLMDIEEQTAVGAGPGMRLALVDNQLRVEYKFLEDDIIQPSGINFPRNQWVELIWEIKLSTKKKGTVKLWQDGQLIIDTKKNRTLPKDILYFQQGTKGMYSSAEIGITANSEDNDLVLWVDNVKFEKVN